MNRIYKVIWSRCTNAFIVVSEIARSVSAGATRNERRIGSQTLASILTKIAGGMALAFGLTGVAGAQTAAAPAGSVHTVTPATPALELTGATVTNTAYGNALEVASGSGGEARIVGGTFTIEPTAPNETRIDTEPYAGIRIETVSGEDVYLKDDVQVNVTGENLHGVHLAESYSWLSSSGTQINATGKDTIGLFSKGTASLRGDILTVDGENARGIRLEGGSADIQNVEMRVSGTGSTTGIDVQGGDLQIHQSAQPSLDLAVNGGNDSDTNATGIRFAGALPKEQNINDARIIVTNTEGNQTIGIHFDSPVPADDPEDDLRVQFINAEIEVVGNPTAGSTSGVKIEGLHTYLELGLQDVALNVQGNDASGVLLLAADSSADISGGRIDVNGDGAHGIKAEAHSANLYIRNDAAVTVTGANGTGISLEDEGGLQVHSTDISVVGDNGTGFLVRNDGYVDMTTSSVQVEGGQSVGIRVVDSTLRNIRFSSTDVSATGADSMGLDAENAMLWIGDGSTINAHGVESIGLRANGSSKITIENSTVNALGDQSTGIDTTESVVTLRNSTIDVNSADLPGHGILARNSVIDIEGGLLRAEGVSSVRGILSMGDDHDVRISAADINTISDVDAWALVSDGGSLSVTDGTSVFAEGGSNGAMGVYGGRALLTLADSTIKARSDISRAKGINATMASVLEMSDVDVIAEAGENDAIGVNLDGQILAEISGGSISALGKDNATEIFAIIADNNSLVSVNGTQLFATSESHTNDTGAVAAMAVNGSHISLTDGTEMTVKGGLGLGTGVSAIGLNSHIEISDAIIDVEGSWDAAGVVLFDHASVAVDTSTIDVRSSDSTYGFFAETGVLDVSDSDIQITHLGGVPDSGFGAGIMAHNANTVVSKARFEITSTNEAVGLASVEGTLHISDTDIQANAQGAATGVLISATSLPASLEAVRINVAGGDGTAAVLAAYKGSTIISGGSQLASSHHGIILAGDDEQIDISLTDTQVTAGTSTLTSWIDGSGTQRFNLGSGVVATDNNGTLLSVERDPNIATGRVELNLADGAVVAGAIRDDVGSLSDLTADGGTHLSLSNASYAGSVENVRSVSLANAAHIGGGTVATPNTVLENVSVDNAVLSGNWDIAGTLQARNQARVAPGNSVGVIRTHAIDWGPGTIYEVEVNDAGQSDRIDVTGPSPADMSQTALHVMQEDGTGGYRLDHDYTILTAAGGIDGSFISADWLGSELITVNPAYGADHILITLSVDEQALNLAGFTSNQRATADGALSAAGVNSAADAAFLSSDPAASFDLLSGEIHPSTRAGLMNSSVLMSSAILGRLRDRSPGPADPAATASDDTTRYPMWISYAHTDQTTKGDSNTARRKHSIDGFSLGGDAELGDGWKVGGAFSYTDSDIKLSDRHSRSDVDSYGLALYAGKTWKQESGSLNFMAGLGHTWHDISTRRSVDLGGSQTLKASYDAQTTQLFGELGYAMAVGEQSQIEPYLGLTWLQHRTDSFNERGGSAALKGGRGTEDVAFSTLGLRGTTTIEAGETAVRLRAGLGWRHAFGDRDPRTRLAFIEGGGSSFTITGAPIARNTAVFDVGAEVQVGRHTSIGLGYEGQAGSGYTEHTGNLYLKTRF